MMPTRQAQPDTNARPLAAMVASTLGLALALLASLGCAIQKAQSSYDQGRYEEALEAYREILRKDPGNVRAKIGFRKTAPLAAEVHLKKAREAHKFGRQQVVQQEVAAAVLLDPANAVAVDWMNRLEEAAARQRAREDEEESVDQAKARAEAKPTLPINPRSLDGMDLNFARKTSLKEILAQLSRNSGVNIILHSSVSAQDPQVSVDLRGLTFQRVLDTLMLQSDLFYKVLDPNTIMVFKKTPQNLNDFENKLIQTFFLSNAEPDAVRTIFNAIMPQVRVFIDKRLNALTVQARASDLAIAQRIVGQLDKAKAEVMIYLELMEVSNTAAQNVGLIPTTSPLDITAPGLYRIGATTTGYNGQYNQNPGGLSISKSNINFIFAPLALDMLKLSGEAKLLASPNVRVVSGETGEVNIGEKISTTQSQLGVPGTSSGTPPPAGGGLTSIPGIATAQTSYTYEDAGVQIKVKPRVHFNNDITIELDSTVKNRLGSSIPGRPDLGQRIIKTTARLRDGETAIFGGLLKEDEVKNLQGIWGISDIPILGKLLGHNDGKKSRVDVILSLRAVVVRKPDLVEEDFEPYDPDQAPGALKPFAPKPEKKALPRGLQREGTEPTSKPAPGPLKGAEAGAAESGAKAEAEPGTGKETVGEPASAATVEPQAAKGPATPDSPSSLVFFLSPLAVDAPKGQRVTLNLFTSGAQGVTAGTMNLQVDPRLRVVGVTPGEFLTADGGDLKRTLGRNGQLTLAFTRPKGATDTGTFATLELEALEPGKASVLIQDGTYQVGSNPIPARYVNALVTVQ